MIAYKIDNIPSQTVTFLQQFESEFREQIKSLLNTEDFRILQVNMALSVISCKSGEPMYNLESNASFSIHQSNALMGKITDYLTHREKEFQACFPDNACLDIHLNFKEVERDKEQNKDNDLTFIPVTPKYSFEQVILPADLKTEIEDALNIIQYQNLIYKVWGFEKVDPVPKSVLNFYGPPGTGKTMCAHAIASKLGKKLLALNYAEIESKYVGEAPKNLMKAFETAKKEDCVLFFDEADSFLGKRIQNVTQGADQALNSLRSQMLILLEEYSGVVIFATNLVSNFDKAFESRILKHLKFDLPNAEARKAIIKSMIPSGVPLEHPITDEEYDALSASTDGLAGREIKNAILETLITKASREKEHAVFTYEDFKKSFEHRQEMLTNLKEEEGKEKKEKILRAFKKQAKENTLLKDKESVDSVGVVDKEETPNNVTK